MNIRYTVWEHVKIRGKKKLRTTNGEIEWSGDWDKDDHVELRAMIHKENPGKHIMGYCPAEKWEEFTTSINEANPELNIR